MPFIKMHLLLNLNSGKTVSSTLATGEKETKGRLLIA